MARTLIAATVRLGSRSESARGGSCPASARRGARAGPRDAPGRDQPSGGLLRVARRDVAERVTGDVKEEAERPPRPEVSVAGPLHRGRGALEETVQVQETDTSARPEPGEIQGVETRGRPGGAGSAG